MSTVLSAPSRLRRSLAVGVLTASATVSALLAAPPAAAQQSDGQVTAARAAGENRFATAALLATLEFDTAEDVFLASGGDFADALAASFAAGRAGVEHGPILLSAHRDLTDPTRAALDELAPRRAFVLGGPAAIHPDVVAELETRGYDEVVRIAGEDRYDTAARIAFAFGADSHGDVGTLEGQRTALLASGEDFADALAAGPVAARAQLPLFLTPSTRPHAETDRRLGDLDIERIVVVGGRAAVSSEVVRHYEQQGYALERWAGQDRNVTAAEVAENARLRLGFDASLTLLARGDDFPDALAASIHAGRNASPILLTQDPDTLSAPTRDWLAARCPGVDVIRALGGTAAISKATLEAAVDAAESCSASEPGRTQQSYIQAPQEARSDSPGTTFEVTVSGFREADNPAPVDVALFPCEAAAPTDPDDNTFADADNDGHADAIGTTGTGSAVISSLHGDSTSTTHLDAVQPDAQDQIRYTIHSDAQDCAVNVVFHDANGNDQLDVDDQGRPLEHWNYGLHEWATAA
jgi:putative cell wall-binding protein